MCKCRKHLYKLEEKVDYISKNFMFTVALKFTNMKLT